VLTTVAASHPGLLLLVDDIQWVDEATSSVLGYLVRHGLGVPTLLVTARRRPQGEIGLLGLEHIRSGRVEVLDIGPLSPAAVELLIADVPPVDRTSIVRAAGGNPFFLTQLAGRAQAIADPAEGRRTSENTRYPPAVTAAILAELAETATSARLLAQAGAVLGEPFEVVQAGRLAGLEDGAAYTAADALLERSLLSPADEHGAFRFRHPVIASVIYESMSPGWRLATHARAAQLLAAAGAGSSPVARHLEHSATVGDIAAIDQLARAAAEALALAPRTSARLYGSALRLTPDHGPLAERRITLVVARADALIMSGQFAAAQGLVREALARVPAGDNLVRGALLFHILRAERWLGLRAEVADRLVNALDDLGPEPSLPRISLECLLILAEGDRANLAAVHDLRDSIARSAEALEMPSIGFFVEGAVAIAESQFGSTTRGLAACRAACTVWDSLAQEQQPLAVEGLMLLSSAEYQLELWPDALNHAKLALRIARSFANQEARIWSCLAAEGALTQLGRPTSGVDLLDEAEQLARMQGNPLLLATVLARRAYVAVFLGDLSKALSLAAETEHYLDLTPDIWTRSTVSLLLGAVFNSAGRPDRTVELLTSSVGGTSLAAVNKPAHTLVCELLVNAHISLGQIPAARDWARRALSIAVDVGLAMSNCRAQRAHAALALAEGRASDALAVGREAVESAEAAAAPIEAAVARLLVGGALVMGGRRDEAVAEFQDALGVFDAAGTRRLSGLAARELRTLGVRTSGERGPRDASGVGALSDRESEVAQLVADGLTNRQIADELVLSSRTVESHLRRIFVKLEIRSRGEVGTALDCARIVESAALREAADDELR
jgi:DNA-binding NarL/FixJ family response regulator